MEDLPCMCTQVVLGQALHQVDELLPSSSLPFDDIAAAVLLVFFGVRTLQVSLTPKHVLQQTGFSPCCCSNHTAPAALH